MSVLEMQASAPKCFKGICQTMRLDKFLKMSRLIKRRTLANELCDVGGVMLNGKRAKASNTVKLGDVITLTFGNRLVEAEIITLPTKPAGNLVEAATIVTILKQEKLSFQAAFPVDDEEEALP